jgi:type IX secretion system PorP/SprF family membrane protein
MKLKIYLTAFFCLLLSGISQAQQNPMISQYMFNGLFLNPAYAGSHRLMSTTMHHRSQWVGFEGAPTTNIIAFDAMLPDKKNAIGAVLSHDKIGVTSEAELLLNYAYHIKLSGDHRLSLGLRGGASLYTANLHALSVIDPEDPAYFSNINARLFPKAGFGAFYYSKNAFVGLSIPTLLVYDKERPFNADVNKASIFHRHYFLTGGYIHKLSEEVKVRPSVLIKYLPQAPVQTDFNLNFLFYDSFWIGGSYRTGESIVGLFEFHTNFGMRIGYSYDHNFTRIRKFSHGSHELLIGYEFGRTKSKLTTPRYF